MVQTSLRHCRLHTEPGRIALGRAILIQQACVKAEMLLQGFLTLCGSCWPEMSLLVMLLGAALKVVVQ